MSVDCFPLSEGDFTVIPAGLDKRKRVSVAAGEVTINHDYAADHGKYEPAEVGESFTIEKATAIRGPGRIYVSDFDMINPQGEHPDTEAKLKATGFDKDKTTPAKKDEKKPKDDRKVKSDDERSGTAK